MKSKIIDYKKEIRIFLLFSVLILTISGSLLINNEYNQSEESSSIREDFNDKYFVDSEPFASSNVYSGSRTLKMKGGFSWVAEIYYDNLVVETDFTIECYFYIPNGGLDHEGCGGVSYKGIGVGFKFDNSQDDIRIEADGNSADGISPNAWHKLNIDYVWDTHIETVYIDGYMKFSLSKSISESGEKGGNRFWLSSGNQGESGAIREIYYDNIKLLIGLNVYFSDGFEANAVNDFPSGWTQEYSGLEIKVVGTEDSTSDSDDATSDDATSDDATSELFNSIPGFNLFILFGSISLVSLGLIFLIKRRWKIDN